jgi:hypothetical protein
MKLIQFPAGGPSVEDSAVTTRLRMLRNALNVRRIDRELASEKTDPLRRVYLLERAGHWTKMAKEDLTWLRDRKQLLASGKVFPA